jgi:DNA-binding response OmpR family regulator
VASSRLLVVSDDSEVRVPLRDALELAGMTAAAVARVETVVRRAEGRPDAPPELLSDELVTIDFARASVTVSGQEVALTPLEFKLLATFVRHPNQVLAPDQLLDLVWGGDDSHARGRVKLYVAYLRRKLEEAKVQPVETVRGFGYRYRPSRGPSSESVDRAA